MRRSLTVLIIVTCMLVFAGCSADEPEQNVQPAAPAPDIEVVDITAQVPESEPVVSEPELPEAPEETPAEEDVAPESDEEEKKDSTEESAAAESETKEEEKESSNSNAAPIIWLGDSLTQGSLGNDNDNLPNAPYEKLKKMVSVPVEGYGFYGYKTNEIFWVYRSQLGNDIDPKKTYIFWVGSNDWVRSFGTNTDTAPIIEKIDVFLTAEGQVNNYIVIGTTARYELGDSYKIINQALAARYGSHYLDVIDVIGNEYGPDKIHLTQKGYDAVANAVYKKLKALGYV